MTISPLSQYPSLFPTAINGPKGAAPATGTDSVGDSSDPKDIIAEIAGGGSAGLVKYQEKVIEKKARADELKALGLTEADLKSLSPEKLSAVEDAIAKAVKESLKNAMLGDGKQTTTPASAGSDKPAATPNTRSLISSTTLSALFDAVT